MAVRTTELLSVAMHRQQRHPSTVIHAPAPPPSHVSVPDGQRSQLQLCKRRFPHAYVVITGRVAPHAIPRRPSRNGAPAQGSSPMVPAHISTQWVGPTCHVLACAACAAGCQQAVLPHVAAPRPRGQQGGACITQCPCVSRSAASRAPLRVKLMPESWVQPTCRQQPLARPAKFLPSGTPLELHLPGSNSQCLQCPWPHHSP